MKRILKLAAVAAFGLLTVLAQDRTIQVRRQFVVKRDRVADFESSVKAILEVYKKAKVDAPTLTLQSITGPDHYLTIRYYASMADALADRRAAFANNHEGEYMATNLRLADTIDDRATIVSRRDAEVSLPRTTEVPKFFRVVRTVIKPGQAEAYRALLKELVEKGIKPGGTKSFTVLQTVAGGNTAEISTGMGMNSLAELDDPASIKAWGAANYQEWLKRRAAIIESTTVEIYRYRADLSNW
jgi:hypothetical protein